MKYIQYIEPGIMWWLASMDIKPVEFEFACLREFLNHPHIRIFTGDANFKRFNICRDKEYELISVLKDGRSFKIGILDGNISEIPEWNPGLIVRP